MSWDRVCRTCLTPNTNLQSIYSSPDPLALEYEYSETYSQMIQSVTSIHIKPNDKLPQKICPKCVDNLLNAFNFQKVAMKTEEALRSLQPPEMILIKEEIHEIKTEEGTNKSNNKNKLKIRNIKTLQQKQNATNGIKRKLVKVPLVQPPPLISLSESKVTPPPLVFLPKKTKKLPKEEIPCKYCNIKLTTEFLHKVHLLSHEINLYHVCPFCEQQPKDLMKHLKEHYKYTTCTNCKMKFYSIAKYENHMRCEHNKYIPQ